MRRIPGTIARAAAALVTVSGLVAQQAPGTNLEVLQVRPNFYMIAGAGGNIGFQVGADGVVVVDSGSASNADAVVAAIRESHDATDPLCDQHQRRSGSCGRQ